jgi:DNA modification methylase
VTHQLLTTDCVDAMRQMDEASIDAIVCDPPYGLEFMGKTWDRLGDLGQVSSRAPIKTAGDFSARMGSMPSFNASQNVRCRKCGHWRFCQTPCECAEPDFPNALVAQALAMQEWHQAWATEALRVLKPGGHLLAFGGTRTYHRLACAVEDAGFEIRDSLIWLYGSGFPKSLDVAKAIDKAERGVPQGGADPTSPNHGRYRTQATEGKRGEGDQGRGYGAGPGQFMAEAGESDAREFVEAADRWSGWGTALKPAHEPIVVARKPLIGTVAQNVTEHGTGALNIDATRIGDELIVTHGGGVNNGRWPANVALSPEAAAELDEQSGERKAHSRAGSSAGNPREDRGTGGIWKEGNGIPVGPQCGDAGGVSRYFYTAKASRAERNAGFEEQVRPITEGHGMGPPNTSKGGDGMSENRPTANVHPTVKPIDLMRWLVRLVTPPGGTCLDPFAGSGTTGVACVLEGFDFIGIEREAEYVEIAKARVEWWSRFPGEDTDEILIRARASRGSRARSASGLSERIEREHTERGQLGLLGGAA